MGRLGETRVLALYHQPRRREPPRDLKRFIGACVIHQNDLVRLDRLRHQCSKASFKESLAVPVDNNDRDSIIQTNLGVHLTQLYQGIHFVIETAPALKFTMTKTTKAVKVR